MSLMHGYNLEDQSPMFVQSLQKIKRTCQFSISHIL